ncbi:MAG: hypothetical protein D4R68_07245 [Ignavibacteriales bacterium]|nr:MAG: hypothetical protein D4R68_07245 [Ignavibacteriales bacterium]
MNRKSFIIFLSITSIFLCANILTASLKIDSTKQQSKPKYVTGIYRVPCGEKENKKIWIVDGLIIRREIYPEFLYGGNNERYPFIPRNEIWIDHAISAEEFSYTLAHELHERNLMATQGMSYSNAHDSSLALERRMRKNDFKIAKEHEKLIPKVSPTDCDGIKQIVELPDSIILQNIYHQKIEVRNGVSIWIVDGAAVRRGIYPDFGLSGNDLAYKFIPTKEIWIDGNISCEETEFSILCELKEREFIDKGMGDDDAYLNAIKIVAAQRNNNRIIAKGHQSILIPNILERDLGTGSEKKSP